MSKNEKANEIEVTRESRIKEEAAKIKAKEDEMIAAEAAAVVDAELAAEAEKKRLADEAVMNEKARIEQNAKRAQLVKAFAGLVADWMIASDCDNPASIPASAVSVMRTKAGL